LSQTDLLVFASSENLTPDDAIDMQKDEYSRSQ
jgi:hypothetical protein